MKKIKHIWKYLTSPSYRFWVDFATREENLNQSMNAVMDNLELMSKPMFYVDSSPQDYQRIK